MIKFENNITINRPQKQVFDFLTDVQNVLKFEGSEVTEVSEGPIRVGFKLKLKAKIAGRKYDGVLEYTEYEPNRWFGYKISLGPLELEGRVVLDPIDSSSTQVASSSQIIVGGALRLLEPVIASEFKKEDEAELKKTKELIEASA